MGDSFEVFKGEPTLLLEASDLNSKNFSLSIAQILLKPKSIIYIDTDHLTKKGGERLTKLLEDIKNLFDDRLWIILVNQKESSGKFELLVEKQFDLKQNIEGGSSKPETVANKRRKIAGSTKSKSVETPVLIENDSDMEERRDTESEKIKQLEAKVQDVEEEDSEGERKGFQGVTKCSRKADNP